MSSHNIGQTDELTVDISNLYREELYSDRRTARVRQLIPVLASGEPDTSRQSIFVGETSVLTQMGALPLSFEIEATSLQAAFEQFPEGVAKALEDLNERARELAREEASRIVVPTGAPPGLGGMPGGGLVLK